MEGDRWTQGGKRDRLRLCVSASLREILPTHPTPTSRQQRRQGTFLTPRPRLAVVVAGTDDEGVVLVVEGDLLREVVHEQGAHLRVGRPLVDQPVAGEEPPGVGVADEGKTVAGVQEDRVDRLRPEAVHLQELGAPGGEVTGEVRLQVAAVEVEMVKEIAQPPCLDVEIARRLQELGERLVGEGEERLQGEAVGLFQVVDGPLDITPRGILGKDRPHRHLEGRLPRPPVLWPEGDKEAVVDVEEAVAHRVGAGCTRDPRRRCGRSERLGSPV